MFWEKQFCYTDKNASNVTVRCVVVVSHLAIFESDEILLFKKYVSSIYFTLDCLSFRNAFIYSLKNENYVDFFFYSDG